MTKHLLTLAALALTATTAQAQSATAIPVLDLNPLPGVWFEQAHLPAKSEKHCISSPTVVYALDDKPLRLQIVQTCKQKDTSTNISNAIARTAKKPKKLKPGQVSTAPPPDGKMKIPYFLPYFLATKYWILAEAPDYSWIIVGTPNHKTLQILSKTPTIPPQLFADLQSRAAAQGFAVARLVRLPQTP